MGDAAIAERSETARVPHPARTHAAGAQGSRMGADRQHDAAGRSARGCARTDHRPGDRQNGRTGGCHPRQAPLGIGAATRGDAMNRASAAWLFLAPALLVLGVFFLLPVLAGFGLSLTDYDLYALADFHNLRFVGLANYWGLLHRPLFWAALGHTLYFVAVGVPLSMLASLGTALLLNASAARCKPFFRTALFAPVVTTVVAVAVIWRYLFNTQYGVVNALLDTLGLLPVDWLGDLRWTMPTIILFAVWKNFGYNMIIFLAGLQAIPSTLYEAPRMHGASPWRQFRHITWPMLRPTLLMVAILTVSGYFQLFAEPYVMTEGGPLQSTVSVLYLMYDEGFTWWNLGSASAVAFALFVVMFAVTALMLRLSKQDPRDEEPA